jgi:hypothetical protein
MTAGERRRNTWKLAVLFLIAVFFAVFLIRVHAFSASAILDGSIGLVLGLYVCAQPAANAVTMLLYERHPLQSFPSKTAFLAWSLLNVFVLAAGWWDIFLGAARFMDKGNGP